MPYFDEFKVMEEHYIDIKPMNIKSVIVYILYFWHAFQMGFNSLSFVLRPVSKHALNENYYKAQNSVNLPFPTERTETIYFLTKPTSGNISF